MGVGAGFLTLVIATDLPLKVMEQHLLASPSSLAHVYERAAYLGDVFRRVSSISHSTGASRLLLESPSGSGKNETQGRRLKLTYLLESMMSTLIESV